jgi:hydrogenase nickel incorporation protein HypA/HybF
MHELAIAQSLVEVGAREARSAGAARVERIDLRLGSLAGVDAEALSFCFSVAARGTPCEQADLRIATMPAAGCCPACGATCEVHDLMHQCPECGGWPLDVKGGREMVIASLEVT